MGTELVGFAREIIANIEANPCPKCGERDNITTLGPEQMVCLSCHQHYPKEAK